MTMEAYVRDPRFEIHGCGARMPDGHLVWIDGYQFPHWVRDVNWAETAVLCHHAQFDGLILSHHYGIKPALWLDTLSMARLMIGNHISVSLASLAKHYGLEGKQINYSSETGFKGKHWRDMDGPMREMLADGCLHDVALTWTIFEKLMKGET
jgi:hypothetical protein